MPAIKRTFNRDRALNLVNVMSGFQGGSPWAVQRMELTEKIEEAFPTLFMSSAKLKLMDTRKLQELAIKEDRTKTVELTLDLRTQRALIEGFLSVVNRTDAAQKQIATGVDIINVHRAAVAVCLWKGKGCLRDLLKPDEAKEFDGTPDGEGDPEPDLQELSALEASDAAALAEAAAVEAPETATPA